MNAVTLLSRPEACVLSPEEEAAIIRELSAAYRMDEAAGNDPEVRRIAEKIQVRLHEATGDTAPVE